MGKYCNYPLTTTLRDRFASCENIVSRSQISSLPPPWLQHCSNTPTLCCAKNCRCESSCVTLPERSWITQFIQPSCFEIDFEYHSELWKKYCVFTWRHGGHIGVPKQWNGGHIGVPIQSCGIWTPSWVNAFFCTNKFVQMLATWVKTLNTPNYRRVIWRRQ